MKRRVEGINRSSTDKNQNVNKWPQTTTNNYEIVGYQKNIKYVLNKIDCLVRIGTKRKQNHISFVATRAVKRHLRRCAIGMNLNKISRLYSPMEPVAEQIIVPAKTFARDRIQSHPSVAVLCVVYFL